MKTHLNLNRSYWNELTPIHARSKFYGVDGFKAGQLTLKNIELEEMGDIQGKSLLHLQCHFGLDTLSWARLGAKVTGVDFSDKAIDLARELTKETDLKATFVCSDIYELPKMLAGQFDIVFTSYGIICWLPNLQGWAEVIAHFLRPGGIFYMVEDHPTARVFDSSQDATDLQIAYPYFHNVEPSAVEPAGSYADRSASVKQRHYDWSHSLGDVVNALIGAGLRIEFLHEFPVSCWQRFPFMKQDTDGWWRLEGNPLPLTFSIRALKL